MTDLGRALLDSLGPGDLTELARRLAPLMSRPTIDSRDDWLDSTGAAEYLGFRSKHPLHKLTAARAIPFHQDCPRCKCWFKRSELDAWRRGEQIDASKSLPNR